jgi:hypothetical protein
MLKHFRLLPFGAGLAIGFLILIAYKPPKKMIYEYPHPENVKDRVYKDRNGVCYKYIAEKVNCDANESTLKEYPIQG